MLNYRWLPWLVTMFVVLPDIAMHTKSACVFIHGTWAQDETWYRPCGDFFKSVDRCAQELKIVDEVIPFLWSGKLSYQSQREAAQKLAEMILVYDWVILIGHSHGVTVGIIASQIISQNISTVSNFFKIKKFYALGVPVDRTGQIYPEMSVVGKFYNLFSFGDYVQPVNGAYERCFVCHERLVNIAVRIHDEYPSHGQLHHPVIGKELLKIEEYFANACLGNFETFCYNNLGEINFYQQDLPKYSIHYDQKSMLDLDKKAQWMMMALLRHPMQNDTNKDSDKPMM